MRAALFAAQPEPRVWFDTGTYLFCSLPGAAPALDRQQGYSWFLRGLRAISADLRLIQATQLALSLITALLFYGSPSGSRRARAGAARGARAVPVLAYEPRCSRPMCSPEALFLFLVALAGLRRGRRSTPRSPWLLGAAGLAAGASASVRVVGLRGHGLLAAMTLAAALRGPAAAPASARAACSPPAPWSWRPA